MAEVRFYHLTEVPLERALPVMLSRTLERDQRAVVRSGHVERLGFLNTQLWTNGDASFVPHGMDGDPEPSEHPIWLTTADVIPNGANALFLIDGASADPKEMSGLDLTAILFDGHDPVAVEGARAQWRAVTAAGLAAVYWAQTAAGGWEKKAESSAS